MFEGSDYKVIDLRVDTKAEIFVEAVRKYKPDILGLSELLPPTLANISKVLHALEEVDLREMFEGCTL